MNITRTHKSWTRSAAAMAAALGLTFTMVSPASAAAGDASSSFGVSASGLVNLAAVAPSAYDSGLDSNFVANASAGTPKLVSTGIINTTAGSGGSTAVVNGTNVALSPTATLTADVISSSCSLDPVTGAATGTSSIVNGATTVLKVPTALAASAAPNTSISVAGATIILNRQVTSPDGTLTVDAIHITLASLQTVTIASSTCTPGTILGVSMLPMSSAVGASLLGLSGLVFFIVRRRQTQHSLIEA